MRNANQLQPINAAVSSSADRVCHELTARHTSPHASRSVSSTTATGIAQSTRRASNSWVDTVATAFQ